MMTIITQYPFDIEQLIEICRKHGVEMLAIFGSIAHGTANDQSDIDLLVRFAAPIGLIGMELLEQKLEHALGRDVDLLTESSVSPYLRPAIMHDLQVIYDIV